jgi:hypothetical protein
VNRNGKIAYNIDFNNNSYISNDPFEQEPKKKKDFLSKVGGFFGKAANEVGSKIKDFNIKEKAQVVANKGKEIIVKNNLI